MGLLLGFVFVVGAVDTSALLWFLNAAIVDDKMLIDGGGGGGVQRFVAYLQAVCSEPNTSANISGSG